MKILKFIAATGAAITILVFGVIATVAVIYWTGGGVNFR